MIENHLGVGGARGSHNPAYYHRTLAERQGSHYPHGGSAAAEQRKYRYQHENDSRGNMARPGAFLGANPEMMPRHTGTSELQLSRFRTFKEIGR